MLLVMLMYALFASVYTVAKVSLQYSTPLFIVGSRMFTAGVLMLLYLYLFNREALRISPKHYGKVFLLGLFNIYLTNIFAFIALQHLDSFKSCFTYSLSPFITAIFMYMLFSEHLSRKQLLGLTLGFVGFIPILCDQASGDSWMPIALTWSQGIMFLSVFSNVYGWILLQQLVRDAGYSSLMMNGLSMLFGGGMGLMHSFLVEEWNPLPVTEFLPFIYTFIFLIIISNFICYNLYGILLKRFSATFLSFAGFSTPLFTALFGWLFLGEIVTVYFILSVIIVFVGLLIFSQEEVKTSKLEEQKT